MSLLSYLSQRVFVLYIRQYVLLCVSIVALVFFAPRQAQCEYIAQINIQQAGIIDSVYIKLLENDAPITVQNFRNYVNDGDYTDSFIHRVAFDSFIQKSFIVQGGGFTFDPMLNNGDFSFDTAVDPQPGGLQLVPVDTPIDDEVGHTNVRGTLAMAKEEALDSAKSQWFINLVDNSFLDTGVNGGFTVFAEVLGDGMDVVDGIANQTIFDLSGVHSAFNFIPLHSYTSLDAVVDENLIKIKSIAEVLSITSDINYSAVTLGTNRQSEVVLLNTSNDPVSIGRVEGQKSLSPPYRLVNQFCSNSILPPGGRCSVIALFEPEVSGDFDDSFDIEFPDLGVFYTIKLTGTGGPDAIEPDISSEFSSIDFGERSVIFDANDSAHRRSTTLSNTGEQLNLNTITLSPDSDDVFSISSAELGQNDNCINVTSLNSGETCRIRVLFRPLVEGDFSAKLIVESNDPDESPFEISIFAVAVPEDTDGISNAIEGAAPNSGDGNNDSLSDNRQSNVASLPDLKGSYNTYVSELLLNQVLSDVRIIDQDATDRNPDNIVLEAGVHEFTIENVAFDEVVEVGLLLPAGVEPSAYYVYGQRPENPSPQWYKFDIDGETGASFIGVAKFTSPSGDTIDRNVIVLRIKNGGRGDSTNVQDNKVVVTSGINYSNSNSGSGVMSFLLLQAIVLILLLLRVYQCFYRRGLCTAGTNNQMYT